ncbi:MAG: L-threonylcarbamoyladenylate synthase [bacterium]
MQVINITDSSAVSQAVKALAEGKIIIYPTETCYGLGVDAGNPDAVSRLLTYKGDRYRQVSIAVNSLKMAKKYVSLNSMASNLFHEFLPGPITVISNSRGLLDSRLESTTGTLGVRFPAHPLALSLIKAFGKPLTATSANTSGKKEPYSLADWQKYTTKTKQNMVSLFLDAGQLLERPTSTVVDTTLNSPTILRQGQILLPKSAPHFLSHSPAETRSIAKAILAPHLSLLHHFPLIIALQGELGAGKTQFSQGLAQALNINSTVASPTYTLLREYPYHTPKYSGMFYHLDTWRLADMRELETTLHLSSLLKPSNLLAIEWAGKAKNLLKSYKSKYPILVIDIKELSENTRQINYAFSTPEWS